LTLDRHQTGPNQNPQSNFLEPAAVIVRLLREEIQGHFELRDCPAIGASARCLLSGASEVFDRLRKVSSSAILMSQLIQMVVEAVGVKRFDRGACPLMELSPPFDQD
jgi:hypothetical protein